MSNIVVKVGDDVTWIGQVVREGVTDYTGYTLSGEVRSKSEINGDPGALMGAAQITWLDAVAGSFSFHIPRAVTAKWPAPACLLVDIRIAAPDGKWLRTDTAEFKTALGVTQ